MIVVNHPLLPYSLELDEGTGHVVRRHGGVAEEGTPTDAVLVLALSDIESLKAKLAEIQSQTSPLSIVSLEEPVSEKSLAKVNVNTATQEQIADLPHIGKQESVRIVELRKSQPFTTLDELLERSKIRVKPHEKDNLQKFVEF